MTSKHVIRESESPRPAASSILISRMTRSSVIIPYVKHNALVLEHMFVNRSIQTGCVASKILYNRGTVDLTLARPVWIDPKWNSASLHKRRSLPFDAGNLRNMAVGKRGAGGGAIAPPPPNILPTKKI